MNYISWSWFIRLSVGRIRAIVTIAKVLSTFVNSFIRLTLTDLEVPELGEGVDDDTEDDVQSDGRDKDEE